MTLATITECPKCGESKCMTIDSRVDRRGWRRRRRGCNNCGHKWSTLEIQEDEIENLIVFHDKLVEMQHTIQKLLKPHGRGKSAAQTRLINDN